MNRARTFTSAIVVAALCMAAVPAGAQERRGNRDQRGGERAKAGAPAQRQDRAQRARPRQTAPPERAQGQSERQRSREATAPRARENRSYENQRRAVPRSYDRPSNRGDNRRAYQQPRRGSRSFYSRPSYYSRLYLRPHNYVPYRPYRFSRPYYSFRPRLSIGLGLWIGNPVPYPYGYLGSYRPRVYGYYPDGSYGVNASVPIYGGVSFDIEPSDADLFIDGEYVGQIGNFTPNTEPLTLTPGVHRIAVQRDGFRPMEWEVSIEPGQVIPYRGAMDRY